MRYTTLIDVSEWPELYRSVSVRLVYLHLVLKSGYHDHDRDQIRTSLRRIAADTGCTLAAVRHAVDVLQRTRLLKVDGRTWTVTKWVVGQAITSRAQQKAQAAAEAKTSEQRARARERELRDMERERQREADKEQAITWEEFQKMKSQQAANTK